MSRKTKKNNDVYIPMLFLFLTHPVLLYLTYFELIFLMKDLFYQFIC